MAATEKAPRQIALVTALLLLGTFAAGIAGGVGLCRWLAEPPPRPAPPPPPSIPGIPSGELGLSPEQERRARAISDRHRPELEAIIRETFPQVRAINDAMEQELRAVLTPEQQRRLDGIKARRPPPVQARGPGLGPPPGAPGESPPALPPPPAPGAPQAAPLTSPAPSAAAPTTLPAAVRAAPVSRPAPASRPAAASRPAPALPPAIPASAPRP